MGGSACTVAEHGAGQSGVVLEIKLNGRFPSRVLYMGLAAGQPVIVHRKAPLGSAISMEQVLSRFSGEEDRAGHA